MSSPTSTFFNKARHVWRTIFRKGETPRELQERNDLYANLLLLKHHALRLERFGSNVASCGGSGKGGFQGETREQVLALVDEVADVLENKDFADEKSIVGLRYEQQRLVSYQLIDLFRTFQDVDSELPPSASGNDETSDLDTRGEDAYRSILSMEYDEVRRCTVGMRSDGGNGNLDGAGVARSGRFRMIKRSAIETILVHKGWTNDDDGESISSLNVRDDDGVGMCDDARHDAFGYRAEGDDERRVEAMRYYQMINLAKAAKLRHRLGFSIVSLRSTIPDAGRGIYVDGAARAGSLLAFFPGEVWPKEHLTNSVLDSAMFKTDPNLQLSMRYDDILIDARRAPYTVLNRHNSNPFAVAHIANHGKPPNCRTVAVNFTDDLRLKTDGLDRYVPNTYARLPMLIGQKMVDRDVIDMHGFALLASRDVRDEELVYDYRLSPDPDGLHPDWYAPYDEEESLNRWWQDSLA